MSICCGHTAAQLPHPMQALGFLSSGSVEIIMLEMKSPLPVSLYWLYMASSCGMSSPMGQWLVQ